MNQNNLVLTTLSDNPEYFEEVISLIEEEFHYTNNHHYERDFAPLVNPLNFDNCFLYVEQETNRVVAHLGVCLRKMIKGESEISVALIGGIVTHKKHRGAGLFKNLMNHALVQYQEKVGLFILWSDLENIYEKFSFFRTGGLVQTGNRNLISADKPLGFEKKTFDQLSDKEFDEVVACYKNFNEKYFFTIKREDKEWSIIREMSSIDLYVKKNKEKIINKYFCINKGRDLTHIIHEISCSNKRDFLSFARELTQFKVWLPETELESFPHSEVFYTSFIKIASSEILNIFLAEITKNELRILNTQDNLIEFQYREDKFKVSYKDFLQYLFGPKPLVEFAKYDLSLYITGADSI